MLSAGSSCRGTATEMATIVKPTTAGRERVPRVLSHDVGNGPNLAIELSANESFQLFREAID